MSRKKVQGALKQLLLLCLFTAVCAANGQEGDAPAVTEAQEASETTASPPAPEGDTAVSAKEVAEDATAGPLQETAEAPGEDSDAGRPDWIRGSLDAGIDAEWSDRDSDIDLYQSLRLRLTHPEHTKLSLITSLMLHEELGSNSRTSALNDINDAYSGDVQLRLYDLYGQYERLWGNTTVRLGRQRVSDSPWYNRIDGLHIRQYQERFDWYAYLGARASVYRDAHDDFVGGGGASYRLTDKTRAGLDLLYADEDRDGAPTRRFYNPIAALLRPGYPRRISSQVSDTQIALSLWHDFTPNVRFFGRFTLNDGDADEFLLDLTGHYDRWDLTYQITYRQQLQRITDRANDLTSYYRILGPERAFKHVLAALHKPLNEQFTLSLEGEVHDAKADDWMGSNRDYWRLAAMLHAKDLYKGVDATMGLERWDVEHGEEVWAVTGELRRDFDKWETFLGADYERYRDELLEYNPWPGALYQFSLLTVPGFFPRVTPGIGLIDTVRVRTRENIYSVYAGFTYELREDQTVRGKVTFEDDEGPDSPYWRIQASYEIKF